ncbi:DUF2125 domain-containing protein [uncultured Paracoccus sp.]|uniref:DUF2125 domain-containing protein n=1 Tax=uncultured Paracoccus sp. TaxID=189685 RepID=UPI00261293F4|nr:DUF2125 domain-containing protein [uncultured Paracoccus sp.]
MRVLIWIVVLVALLVGGLWLGGESWLAGRATAMIDQREDVAASAVTPLRETRRIGLRADQVEVTGQLRGAAVEMTLPWVDLWVPPTAPVELHATLPETAQLLLDGQPVAAQMQAAQMFLRVSPTKNMAVSRVNLSSGAVDLAGQPLLRAVSVNARLASLGHDAPAAAGAAYDVDLALDGLDPAVMAGLGLPPLVVPGQVGLQGQARVWLDAAPGRGMLQGQREQVRPVGFRSDGMELRIGDLTARLVGEVLTDDRGLPTGRLALYSTDGQAWLKAASDAGLMPAAGVSFGNVVLNGLSQFPMEPVQKEGAEVPTAPARPGFTFPAPAEGETRLPLFLRDGKLFLGAIPIARLPGSRKG